MYAMRIKGLDEVSRLLGDKFEPTMDAVVHAIAEQIENEIKPYPPATIANSPSNPSRHWYERGYGSKWITKKGEVHGRNTSQKLGIRWAIAKLGAMRWAVRNTATYAKYVHSATDQARWHGARGWLTEKTAIEDLIRSRTFEKIFVMAFSKIFKRV